MSQFIRVVEKNTFVRVCYMLCLLLLPMYATAIQAVVSKTLFYAPDDADKRLLRPYIELGWEINPATINWVSGNGGYSAKVITTLEVRSDTGIVYQTAYAFESNTVATIAGIADQRMLDLKRFYTPEGKLSISLKLTDANRADQAFIYQDSATIETPKTAYLSEIQLIDTTMPALAQSIFEKNGKIQIPRNDNFIPDNRKSIGYYAEVYQPSAKLEPLTIKTYIARRGGGGPIPSTITVDTAALQQIYCTSGAISTSKLSSGNYMLFMLLQTLEGQIISSRKIFFQLENRNPEQDTTARKADTAKNSGTEKVNFVDLTKTFLAKYSAPQIRAIMKMIRPISSPVERNAIDEFLRKPDDAYSRYFVLNFWKARNEKDPEDAWKAYSNKVKEVNKLFSFGGKAGYETERGTLWLMYGKPNERVIAENESGALPYELWVYDYLPNVTANGKPMFLFYRPGSMIADFNLLHSTVMGATRNTAWRTILYPGGRSESGVRSRADEYLENR